MKALYDSPSERRHDERFENSLRERANGEAVTVPEILGERSITHGDFSANAAIAQKLKSVFRQSERWTSLSDVQQEALDLFALKLSRILSGDPNYPDHWADIAGYAQLALAEVRRE
jgi:hypothetical protein